MLGDFYNRVLSVGSSSKRPEGLFSSKKGSNLANIPCKP
jgi:hypothetical protein